MITNNFIQRHNGLKDDELKKVFETTGVNSLEELINQTVPASIRCTRPLNVPDGINEYEYLTHIKSVASKNKLFKSYIGLGYYNTILPGVIQRNILENPGWYTSYTPYQAEISQGRLEALLNFQTMIIDFTGLPIANASLLDEGTAAAEAMIMLYNSRSRDQQKKGVNKFFLANDMFAHTIDVVVTRAEPLGIEVIIGDAATFTPDDTFFGILVQYTNEKGLLKDYKELTEKAHAATIKVAVATDLMSLALLKAPGTWGADVVVGSNQRFGVPMGFGGPHAGFFACTEEFKRNIPGRIIGVSVDRSGNRALRMALQTREQHIKRDKATSNICTAQALLAIMSGMYATYHGPKGIKEIARHINILTAVLAQEMEKYGYKQLNTAFFDTLHIALPNGVNTETIQKAALSAGMNFRYIDAAHIGMSLDETTSLSDVNTILNILAVAAGKTFVPFVCEPAVCQKMTTIPASLERDTPYLEHPVFNTYHSETAMMRYMKELEIKDLALNRSMIPLGSCTMKLNAASEMFAMSWPEFGGIHPFVPEDQAGGYIYIIEELNKWLSDITGFAAMSFQPNSGASGEYAGLMVIREYLKSIGQGHRTVSLIPSSAHGTNPASAVMAGMKVVVVKCDEQGNIDIEDLRLKAAEHASDLACIMITYPSTHGVYEEGIKTIINIVHEHGGQVYMDGANMNAQVGITSPGLIGADVCHLNLHKTFAIPHGGGGPGVGPIGVAKHLVPFLPTHKYFKTGGTQGIGAVSSAPFGSASVLTITYAYIKLLGGNGLKLATEHAMLCANYIKSRLDGHYKILYTGNKGRVAHEMILDCNNFKRTADLEVIDIAKRLMDYGFHAPTVAFPVHGTLMVEPTESEPLSELDRFCDAMISIRKEIEDIENGKADKLDNVLKNAPHTAISIASDNWNKPYSREKAVFPVPGLFKNKYWPTVARIDDAYGDRNLVCACEPIENYI
jgi:glycine dehydrogenase